MRAGAILRSTAFVVTAGLVALVVLAIGLESEHQVDPARMCERSKTNFFGYTWSNGRETPLDFAVRFPRAVEGRDSLGWHTLGKRAVVGRTYINGRSGRWVHETQSFIGICQVLEIPPAEADRLARRLIDLVVQGVEFQVDYDYETQVLAIRNYDTDAVLETWPDSTPR